MKNDSERQQRHRHQVPMGGFLFQVFLCLTLALVLAAWLPLIPIHFLRLVLLRASLPIYSFVYISQSWFLLLTVDAMLMDNAVWLLLFFSHFAHYILLNSSKLYMPMTEPHCNVPQPILNTNGYVIPAFYTITSCQEICHLFPVLQQR